MASLNDDRNVLFGILAWQTGLVDRAALMSAMYECTVGNGRLLTEVLTEKGLLNERDRRWLEETLDRQIQGHKNDVGQTLSSMASLDDLKNDLSQIAALRQAATIAASDVVPADAKTVAPRQTIGHTSTEGVAAGTPADELRENRRRFRVLRQHARGGLGEVFVAVDEELKREVALKQILPKQATNSVSRARFLLEAEITGNLEHPGVVPVYALGVQADGCPYYAMRFIRGESLEDAIERYHNSPDWDDDAGQRALELRDLLTRFVAVCNTMEYAHSRGIIHRDIKPENIMLGPYGETLLVDWGLARAYRNIDSSLDSEMEGEALDQQPQVSQSVERPTQMGSVVGTPQFMSPEQAAGRLDLMAPTSDVYSLGATLFCLLTDQPPFAGADVRRVLQDVQHGNFPSPRQVRRDVPPALDAICLKAMQLKPEDRYASARALAADIERWLADEPVSALPESRLVRAQRWMRRHKTWTQAAAAAIVVVACVAGVAYAREASLRSALQTALGQEAAARSDADAARKSAEAHARRAEQQSALALSTLKSVLFDIQDRLKNIPAAHSVRMNMLETTVAGLKQVARSLETAAETDHSLVRAHLDIGDIYFDVGASEATGATALAEEQFRRGMEIAQKLTADPAQRAQAETDLGSAYQRLGDVSMQRGQWVAGTDWLNKSLELRERLARERKDDVKARQELAASVQRLGLLNLVQGDLPQAQEFFSRFLDINRALHQGDPANLEHLRSLSVAEERMGDIALKRNDSAKAEQHFQESLRLRKQLVEKSPGNAVAQRDMSVTLDRLGGLAQERNDLKTADELYRQSLDIRKQIYDDDSSNLQALRDLAVSYAQLGDLGMARSAWTAAAEYFHFYQEIAERLAQIDPGNAQYQRDLAVAYDRLGQVSVRLGSLAEGRDFYVRRREVLEALAKTEPINAELQRELSNAYRDLGEVEQLVGDLAAARGTLQKYLELSRSRASASPQDAAIGRVVTDACFRSGANELRIGDLSTADALLDEAAQRATAAANATPRDVAAWTLLANIEAVAVARAWESRDTEAVASWNRKAMEHVRKARDQGDAEVRKQCDEWLKEFEAWSARNEQARRVADDAEFAAQQRLPEASELLDFRAAALVRKKQWDGSRALLEKIVAADPKGGVVLLLAAKGYLRLIAADPQATSAEKDAARCVQLLQTAYDVGQFRALEWAMKLELSGDFAPLKVRDDFKKLLEKVRADTKPASKPRAGDAVT